MKAFDVLRRAALVGSDLSVVACDSQELATLAERHRMVGRLARYLRGLPPGEYEGLASAFEAKQQAIEAGVRQQLERFSHFLARVDVRHRPLAIKGITSYALTRDPQSMRTMGDVDLLADEPDELVRSLQSQDFATFRSPSPHELLNITADGIDVDLHAYVPVWSYPRPFDAWQTPAKLDDGVSLHDAAINVGRLVHGDLWSGQSIGDPPVGICDPAGAVVVAMTCAFRDYLSHGSVTGRRKPSVRLGDIAEIVEMTRLPSFAPARFERLVASSQADDAVRWTVSVVRALFGPDAVGGWAGRWPAAEEPLHVRFPRAVWPGFWIPIDRSVEELCSSPAATSDIIAAVGATRIASNGKFGPRYGTRAQEGVRRLARVLHCEETPARAPRTHASLSLALTQAELSIRFAVTRPPAGDSDRIFLDVGNELVEWDAADGALAGKVKHTQGVERAEFEISRSADGYSGLVRISSPSLARGATPLPVVLGVGRAAKTPRMASGLLLPIVLEPK